MPSSLRITNNPHRRMLVGKGQTLVEGVVECADAVVPRLDEFELLKALEQQAGQPAHAARPA
jgi:hypothetical protein